MKIIKNVLVILSALFLVWVAASFIDINAHNSPFSSDYKDYASWNFFTLMF